jgi:small-conductance mechanosensitive channel
LIVLPNSIAASQVSINLNDTYLPGPFSINIRLGRDADVEAARRLAVETATEHVGEKAMVGCYLTKVDDSAVTLELRLLAPDAARRDSLRSTVMAALAGRFGAAKSGSGAQESAAFS